MTALAEFLVFIVDGEGTPDAAPGISVTCAAHLVTAVRQAHEKKAGYPCVFPLTGASAPCTAGEHRSSDHSGRTGEATPDDVSRETSSTEPRAIEADANCLRYRFRHEQHVWQAAGRGFWYQCDGTPAYVGTSRCREMETRTCPENRPCVGPCARFGGEPA